jgi:hypothetical protein
MAEDMAKLTGDDKKKFLGEKLEEQRHLLGKSIKEFASGDLAEAVRLAIAMRVLVHETDFIELSKRYDPQGKFRNEYLNKNIFDA